MIGMYAERIVLVILFSLVLCACAIVGEFTGNKYKCLKCGLPENVYDETALIYVMRYPYWLNMAEEHGIYTVQDGETAYWGANVDSAVCALHVKPGRLLIYLRSIHRKGHLAEMELEVRQGETYYLVSKVNAVMSAVLRADLKMVTSSEGEYILHNKVTNKCYAREPQF